MGIFIALIAFTVMVFIHEFGHFIFAKIFKIKVLEFAIGMGPAIFKKQAKETLYSVRCIPIGGYCRMEGEEETSDAEGSFGNAAWWKKFIVVAAGAILNVVLGFALLLCVQGSEKTVKTTTIGNLTPEANMISQGFLPGDKIVKLDNTKINIFEDVSFFLNRVKDSPVEVTVERDGELITKTVVPTKRVAEYEYLEDKTNIKIYLGDKLSEEISVNSVGRKEDIGKTYSETDYILGFETEVTDNNFKLIASRSFFMTGFYVKMVYVSVLELITGKIPANQLSGPIGIVSVIGEASKFNFAFLLEILALLTINLGVMNLLPIPALDGCKLLVILVEAIIRKKLPPEKEGIINLIGFAILIGITIFATYNDIIRLFTNA